MCLGSDSIDFSIATPDPARRREAAPIRPLAHGASI